MDEYTKLISFLSLAKKSGNIKAGEFSVLEAIKSGEAKLVVIARDASSNTKKKFTDKTDYRKIPLIVFGQKEELGRAIGKEETASIAFCNLGMAKAFRDKYGRYEIGKNESV